jgi:hypothetical protein
MNIFHGGGKSKPCPNPKPKPAETIACGRSGDMIGGLPTHAANIGGSRIKWRAQFRTLEGQACQRANCIPDLSRWGCWDMVAKYREAIMAQLLTPAPTAREIEWKRAAFKAGDHEYTDVKPERIERAIADDVNS